MQPHESPFNTVPPAVLWLVTMIVGIELALSAADQGWLGGPGGITWRQGAWQDYGCAPAVITEIFERGRGSIELWQRFLTYPFIHYSFTHALWASVLLLALGKFVGETFGNIRFLAVFFASTVIGALIYGFLSPRNLALLGAYPGVYGLIGAYTYVMWLALERIGENQLKAFQLIGVLLGIVLVYSMIFGGTPLWIAELAGFFVGLTLAPILAPGGWSAFLARIRERR